MPNAYIATNENQIRIGTKWYVEKTHYTRFCVKAFTEQMFQSLIHRANMEETKEDIAYLLYSMLEEQWIHMN